MTQHREKTCARPETAWIFGGHRLFFQKKLRKRAEVRNRFRSSALKGGAQGGAEWGRARRFPRGLSPGKRVQMRGAAAPGRAGR